MTATLGGSRMADAIGVGYGSPLRLWAEMTGQPGFAPAVDNGAMRLGRKLQPLIFSELIDLGHPCVMNHPEWDTWELTDPRRPWLVGHPDGFGIDALDGAVVETKAQAYPHVDLSARVQLQVYQHLGGFSTGILATLASLRVDVVEIPRDDESIGRILALADRFMEYVHAGAPPPTSGHPDERDALATLHPGTAGRKIRETARVREARRELRLMNDADGKHGARAHRKEVLSSVIRAHMGDAVEMIDRDGKTVAKLSAAGGQRTDWKAAAQAAGVDVAPFTTETTTRRLTLP